MADGHSIRFHYQRKGAPADPVLLLLHGFMGSSDDWTDEIVNPLVAAGWQVLAVDLPGHGRTAVDDKDDYFYEYCAPGLVRLLDKLRLERVSLLGYSMGGRLALYLTVRYPERWERVVLESASPGLKTVAERKVRIASDANLAVRICSEPRQTFLREWYAQPLFESMASQPERLEQLIKRRLKNERLGLTLSLQGMGTGSLPSLWDHLGMISTPLLLIVGEKDAKFTSIGRKMAEACPTARLQVVADAGHNVHWEQPREFTRRVRKFLTT